MRKLLPILFLALQFAADMCMAQDNAMTIYCGECRHPHKHPDDYANHAFNQVYGPNAWMSFEQADDFFIVNSRGLKVYVDIDFVFLGFGIEGLRLPFWPKNTLEITLALPNGAIYETVRSVFQAPLPVPADAHDRANPRMNFLPSSNGRSRSESANRCDAPSENGDKNRRSC